MRHLTVETNGQPDTVVRVLSLLRRRRCRIVAVDYREADRHGPGRFRISLEPPARLAHCVDHWLLGLVDVVEVHGSAERLAGRADAQALEPAAL